VCEVDEEVCARFQHANVYIQCMNGALEPPEMFAISSLLISLSPLKYVQRRCDNCIIGTMIALQVCRALPFSIFLFFILSLFLLISSPLVVSLPFSILPFYILSLFLLISSLLYLLYPFLPSLCSISPFLPIFILPLCL